MNPSSSWAPTWDGRNKPDVSTVIKNTSRAIEPIPNNHSGAGIIDAYAGLCSILGLPTAIPSLSKNQPEHVTFRLVGDVLYAEGAADGTPVTVYSLSGTVLQNTGDDVLANIRRQGRWHIS